MRRGLINSGILKDESGIKINLVPEKDINSHRKNRKKIIDSFNYIFMNYCTIERDSLKYIGENYLQFNDKIFKSEIYSLIVQLKNQKEKRYKIYFRHIEIDDSHYIYCCSNIILIPLEVHGDKINEYGLYSKYINTEFYTSKPFDYKNQAKDLVSKVSSPDKAKRTIIGTNYYNICDIISDIFPGNLWQKYMKIYYKILDLLNNGKYHKNKKERLTKFLNKQLKEIFYNIR